MSVGNLSLFRDNTFNESYKEFQRVIQGNFNSLYPILYNY